MTVKKKVLMTYKIYTPSLIHGYKRWIGGGLYPPFLKSKNRDGVKIPA